MQPLSTRNARRRRRFRADLHRVHPGHRRLSGPTGTISPPTPAWRGGRTSRAASCAGCSAIRNRRRSGPATPSATASSASIASRRSTAAIRAGEIAATRNYTTGYPMLAAGETAPVLLRDRGRLGPPAFPRSPVYPIAALPSNGLNVFDPNIETPYVQSFSVGLQRSLGRDTALEVRYVGNRNRHAWAAEDWNEETLFENGFLDRVQGRAGQPRRPRRAGLRRDRHLLVRLPRPGTGTIAAADLPRLLPGAERVAGGQPGELLERELPQLRVDRTSRVLRARSRRCGQRPAREPDVPRQRARGGAGAEFLRDESGRGAGEHHALGERHAVSLAAGRAAPPAVTRPDGERQLHLREQDAVGLHVPAGRRPFGADGSGLPEQHGHPALVQGQLAVGAAVRPGTPVRATAPMASSTRCSATGTCPGSRGSRRGSTRRTKGRLVGMTPRRAAGCVQDSDRTGPRPAPSRSGASRRTSSTTPARAFNTDPTSPTGYGAEGPPTGRYIAPLSSPECLSVYVGDCAARQIKLRGPMFSRVDMRIKKRFPFARKAYVEIDFEMQNVFDSANFNHAFDLTPGRAADRQRRVPRDQRLHRHQHDLRSGRPARADRVAIELVEGGDDGVH